MWRIGRDVHARSRTHGSGFTAEGELKLALKQREHFLEIVAVQRWAAAMGHDHVNQAVPSGCLRAGETRIL